MAWHLYGDNGALTTPPIPIRAGDPVVTTAGLILASLLCDARDGGENGWWGDAFDEGAGDRFGSRLWTIQGAITATTLRQVQDCVTEALAWMVRDGLAKTVTCVATAGERAGSIRIEVKLDGAVAAIIGGP